MPDDELQPSDELQPQEAEQTLAPGDLPPVDLALLDENGGVVSTSVLGTAQGGTGSDNVNGLATSGANANITSLTGLTTALTTGQGGTGTKLLSSGSATFESAGSVTVADASITSSSIVMVTQTGSTPAAEEFSVVINATTGFTIYSSNSSSTATVNYLRIK